MTPDWTNILFVVTGVVGVGALVHAELRDRRQPTAPHRLPVLRRRVTAAGAACIGVLGALFLLDAHSPAWHGVLLALVVVVLVVLMGLVVAALALAVRSERLHAAHRT